MTNIFPETDAVADAIDEKSVNDLEQEMIVFNTQLTYWEGLRASIFIILKTYKDDKFHITEDYQYWKDAYHKAHKECLAIKKQMEVL